MSGNIIYEVQTGCGRTGSLFAYESLGIEPDNSCFDLTSVATPQESHPLAKRTGLQLRAGVPLRIAYRLSARVL